MEYLFIDVLNFMMKAKQPVYYDPNSPTTSIQRVPKEVRKLRHDLVQEEYEELIVARRYEDIEGIADAIADMIYVLIGEAITYGINLPAVWAEVQRANMEKFSGPKRADGKQLKPKGWKPPRVLEALHERIEILHYASKEWEAREEKERQEKDLETGHQENPQS